MDNKRNKFRSTKNHYAALGCAIVIGASVVGGSLLRVADLGNRPMHCDEAVHGIKFSNLLEKNVYRYNPFEFHGPGLNYLTLPVAWSVSARRLTELTDVHLRLVPAFFGILLIGLVWTVRDRLGHIAACFAALFSAVSPALVFYSRYYIQEMLLVCFTFGAMAALWRFAAETQEHRRGQFLRACWVVLFGVCVGLMHTSKETCVIALFALFVAAVVTLDNLRSFGWKRLVLASLASMLIALAVSALFFSSFGQHPNGVIDSYTTYSVYLNRASGEGSVGRHVQSWHYYFRILFWWNRSDGPIWTEASIAGFALVGLIAAIFGKGFQPNVLRTVRFLSVYTLILMMVYSVLPYKTPWCALGFMHSTILLAGMGVALLVRRLPGRLLKTLSIVLALVAIGHLAWQAHRASFSAYADVNSPYVYAHTTLDMPLLVRQIEQLATSHPDGPAMRLQTICPNDDCWPLPWDLRGFPNAEWHRKKPSGTPAPLIIIQPEMKQLLAEYLYIDQPPGKRNLYMPLFPDDAERDWMLRPHVPLIVYVRRDLWTAYLDEGDSFDSVEK